MKRHSKKFVIHYHDKNIIIKSSGRYVYMLNRKHNKEVSMKLPFCFPRDFHFNIPPLKRILRSDAKEIIFDKDSKKLIAIRNGHVYLFQNEKYKCLGSIVGDAPLFNSHCIHNNTIYFGQYNQNNKRKDVHIYKVDNNNNLTTAFTFNAGEIRHIHSISKDPIIDKRLWITTGDNNGECLLLYTDDDFNSISNIGDKSQDYRIVNLGFSKDHLFYGTDNLENQNYLYVQKRENGKREKVLSIKQTAWFLKQDQLGKAIIGTTVEHGKGCQVNYSSLFLSNDFGLSWNELIRIPKDIYPMPLFKWGTVSFSNGSENLNDMFINIEGLKFLSGSAFNLNLITSFSEDELRKIEVKKRDYFQSKEHLMIIIFRIFSIYRNNNDIRYLNVLLKLIDWMPIYQIVEKRKLQNEALRIYESFNNSSN